MPSNSMRYPCFCINYELSVEYRIVKDVQWSTSTSNGSTGSLLLLVEIKLVDQEQHTLGLNKQVCILFHIAHVLQP